MELYKKHRPKKLEDIVGQQASVKVLQSFLNKNRVPHTILFTGPSGCGKTTLARILRKELKCGIHDFTELNCADFNGIDMVRKIRAKLNQLPISGQTRVWIIDEAHRLTTDAQNAFLKILEDTPKHVYFMLATTDPQKLKKTIRTRCTEIVVKSLTDKEINNLIVGVCLQEKVKTAIEIRNSIIEASEGSARKALVILDQIIDLDDEDEMLEVIGATTTQAQAESIAKLLLNPRTNWPTMSKALKECFTEEAESIRWGIIMYARAVLLSGSKLSARAFLIIDAFRDNFYDSKHAGLAAACYEIIYGTEK